MKFMYIFILLAIAAVQCMAQNPISPPGVYIADPSARVWKDGKLYIYGSLDESTNYYCSYRHHVLSTEDMRTWTVHENRFASKGRGDQVEGSDALLFAPDCHYRDGIYYLYFCMPDRHFAEGVATSGNPTGPFRNGRKIELSGYNQIDPAVFIDDDGQAYYIWGQFSAKMAKLKPNMIEIDPETIRDKVLTEEEHFFHEGGFMVKRKGIYYFIYAHMGRANMPTCIGYATSKSPMGPFEYGGVIIDNDHCDPGNWNNHGSIVRFDGQWYVFYHRSTHNSKVMRKACVEPIRFNEDGSIDEVEMTSQGAGRPLKAMTRIEAERACLLYGDIHIRKIEGSNEALAGIASGDKAAFKYIDFGEGVKSITMRIKPLQGTGRIDVAVDQPWSATLGHVKFEAAEGEDEWLTLTAPVRNLGGTHALWLRFYGQTDNLCEVDWLQFSK